MLHVPNTRQVALLCALLLLPAWMRAAIQPALVPSRTTGVAPLAVHFDATGTTATGANAFHDLRFEWSFGDSTSGNWGPSGVSRDEGLGPLTAHVFERAGTYTVSLRITDSTGQSATRTQVITVGDEASVFAGANTVCVSSSGSFANCPPGAQHVAATTFESALQSAATGKRVLLRRGDTFSSSRSVSVQQPGPGTLGAYGMGTALPRVNSSHAGSVLDFASSAEDWRVADIEFRGPGSEYSSAIQGGSARRLLLLRLAITNYHSGVLLSYGNAPQASNSIHEEVFIVDSHLHHFVAGGGGNGVFIGAKVAAVMGNVLEDSLGAEHVMRVTHAERFVIAHNRFADAPSGRHLLKLHSVGENSPATSKRSSLIVISDNEFDGGTNGWDAGIGPQNDLEDERVFDVLVERNLFRSGTLGTINLLIWAQDVTIRNNIFDMSATSGGKGTGISRRGIEPPPTNVNFHNNACYTSSGTIQCASFGGGGTNQVAQNNLVVGGPGSGISTGPTGTQVAANLTMATPPWAATAPTRLRDYRPDAARSSALIDQGVALAEATTDAQRIAGLTDGDGDGLREWDIGAFEIGGSTSPPPPPPSAPAAPVLLP